MTDLIPENLQNILEKHTEPDAMFAALLLALGERLQCDRAD